MTTAMVVGKGGKSLVMHTAQIGMITPATGNLGQSLAKQLQEILGRGRRIHTLIG